MKTLYEFKHQTKKETVKRIKKIRQEFSKAPIVKLFEKEGNYDQIVCQLGIPITAKCKHHEVEFRGKVFIGYMPDKWIVGLSKLARVAEYFLNPAIKTVQEKATDQIMEYLDKRLNPKGMIVVIKADHGCIGFRGVKKPSLTVTIASSGIFSKQKNSRNEFLKLVNFYKDSNF